MKDGLRQFWTQRSPSEQQWIGACIIGLLLMLTYFYVWQPINHERQRLHADLPQLRANAEQMHISAGEIAKLRKMPVQAPLPKKGMREAIGQSAETYNLGNSVSLVINEEGEGRVRIAMPSVAFDKWVGWLGRLQAQYGIRLASCQIDASSQPGMVKVQAVLVGNSAG